MSVEITKEQLTESKESLINSLKDAGVADELINAVKDVNSKINDFAYNGGVGRAYEETDNAIKEATGVEKVKGEQATAYLKRAYKLSEEGIRMDVERNYSTIKNENKTLKEQLKSNPDAEKYTSLQSTYNKALEDSEKAIKELESKYESQLKGYKVKSVINGLGLNHDDKEYLNHKVDTFVSKITDSFDIVEQDGKIVLVGDEKQQHRQFVLEDYAKDSLKDFLSTNPKKGMQTNEPNPKDTAILTAKTKSEAIGKIRDSISVTHNIDVTHPNFQRLYKEELEKHKDELSKLN